MMLSAVDARLTPQEQGLCAGPEADGSLTQECLGAALRACKRGVSPGSDGLPYEFYTAFWSELAPVMLEAFNEAFLSNGVQPQLSETQRLGLITLIYKGKGLPRDMPGSYRPITLLNSDVKIVAKALAMRWAQPLDSVIDGTQSAFVPGRWIGDNVLYHLELLDYLEAQQQPGFLMFLDFASAYDRVDRDWLYKCMDALGMPASAIRWARLLLAGTCARVLVNGHVSRSVSVASGVAQGSPLSPLLYIMAAQPLAARLRQLQGLGRISAITLPGGQLGPPCFMHADDTTVHGRSVGDSRTALQEAVHPFCQASAAQLSISKCTGMPLGGHPPVAEGGGPAAGVQIVPAGGSVRHLGVILSTDRAAAAQRMFEQRQRSMQAALGAWARHSLTMLGRIHVAKQVVASKWYYHATFVPPPEAAAKAMQQQISRFVQHGAVLEGASAGATLHGRPAAAITALPAEDGGLGAPDLQMQVAALHARVAVRFLHPARQPWKVLLRAALCAVRPSLGAALLVCGAKLAGCGALGARRLAYLRALRASRLHRVVPAEELDEFQVGREHLLYNHQVRVDGAVLAADVHGVGGAVLSRVSDLEAASSAGSLSVRARGVWEALPAGWRQAAARALRGARPPQWAVSPDGAFVRRTRDGQPVESYGVAADGRLKPPDLSQAQPASDGQWRPCCVVFCPCPKGRHPLVTIDAGVGPRAGSATRPPQQHSAGDGGEGPGSDSGADGTNSAPQTIQEAFLLGPWSEVDLDPTVWGHGSTALLQLTARAIARRMLRLRALGRWPALFVAGAGMRPKLWPAATGDNQAESGLQGLEQRWRHIFAQRLARVQFARACQCQWSAAAAAPASGPGAGARHGECRGAAAGGGHRACLDAGSHRP